MTAGNVRGAVSTDGTVLWLSTSGLGVNFVPRGASLGTEILTSPGNVRALGIFQGQLYGTSGSGTFTNVFTIGTGIPTMSGQTSTSLPGFPTTGASPYSFVAFDLDANVAGIDTIYVADDRAIASGGGLQKWTNDGFTWTLAYTLTSGLTTGLRGLTGVTDAGGPILYATTTAAAGNQLVQVVDTGSSSSFTTIATAPTNTAFRGVAFAPAKTKRAPAPQITSQ
jgi:hypothetical protein